MFSGLAPATNFPVLLSVGSGSILVGTVVVVSGVLTPDTNAPTFAAVGPMQVQAVHALWAVQWELGGRVGGWVGVQRLLMVKTVGPSGVSIWGGQRPALASLGGQRPTGWRWPQCPCRPRQEGIHGQGLGFAAKVPCGPNLHIMFH